MVREFFGKILSLSLFMFLLFPAASLLCNEVDEVELEEIVVHAVPMEDRLSVEMMEFGHPVEIITSKELEDTGFVELQTAIESLVPGYFSVARAGRGSYNSPSLHGSDKILWLIDGVRINNRLYSKGYPNTLSIHHIDRVEVLKAGESLYYGTEATAGVINIITKGVTDKQSGEAGISYGGKGYMETFGHITGTSEGNGYMIFGSTEGWDGYIPCDNQSYINALNDNKKSPTGFDRESIGLKYRKDLNFRGKASLRFQVMRQAGSFDYGYPTYQTVFSDWEEYIAILKWDHDVTDKFSYYLKSHLHTWWSEATFMNLNGTYLSDAAPWGYDEYGLNFMTSTRWGHGNEILVGVDLQNYWGKDDFPMANFYGETENIVGIFANFRPYIPFSPNSRTSFGARYEKTAGTDILIWDASLKTPVFNHYSIRSVVNTSFTLPNVQQMYGSDPLSNRFGNPYLNPEESLNVEAGVGGEWNTFSFDAGYFLREIEDMIALKALPDGSSTYLNTDGKSKIDGFEISAVIGPFGAWTFNTSATWVDAEDKDTGEQLEKNPEFYAKLNISFRPRNKSYGLDIMTRYTGDIYERGLRNFDDIKYGNYYLVDISAYKTFGEKNRHRVFAKVENLFNEEYETTWYSATNANGLSYLYNYGGLPRNLVAGYKYTF